MENGIRRYIIDGGLKGRGRLRLLSRIMAPTTNGLFDRVGIPEGAQCLDTGCGGGDVALEMARRVGPNGRVVGVDIDATVIEIARGEALERGVTNAEFQVADINNRFADRAFDVVFARFVLTHMTRPERVVENMLAALRPGGLILVEDIDFRGHFCHPPSAAFQRYMELYTMVARNHGGDPNIGPRLPSLLSLSGATQVQVSAAAPCALDGEMKLIAQITMEKIADAVIEAELATADEIHEIVAELDRYARDTTTVMSMPRIVHSWGRGP